MNDKLASLKKKIKRMDPNEESLSDISMRMSQNMSQLSIPRQSGKDPLNLSELSSDCEVDDAVRGKVLDYTERLNDLLGRFERDRVIESATLNAESFRKVLK